MISRMKIVLACALAAVAMQAPAVVLARKAGKFVVNNGHYSATFDPAHGGALTHMAYPGVAAFPVSGRFTCGYDGQCEKFEKRAQSAVRKIDQHAQRAEAEVVREGPDAVVLRFSWKLEGDDTAVQTVSFDDSALIRFEQRLVFSRPIGHAAYRLFSQDTEPSKAVFLPEGRNFTGVWTDGQRSRFPRWKFLTDGRVSFGLVADDDSGWDCFNFFTRTKSRDWGDMGQIELCRLPMADLPCPGEATLRFGLLATKWKAVAFDAAQSALPANPPMQLCDIEPDFVRCAVGGENGLRTTIVNNTKEKRRATVRVELVSGLGDTRAVREETVSLGPREMREWRAKWKNEPSVEWGVASRVILADEDGRELDRRADVTTVADSSHEAVMFYIINPGFGGQSGQEAAWADALRRSYIGAFEYYVWTQSTWDPTRKAGLSPEADEWHPMTESSGFRDVVKKQFLKDIVKFSHDRGIAVYSWITGLVNYRMAYAYPDMFQYCRNGQLSIYNGKMHGKDRFAVAKLAPYTVEAARDWGEQMADSVDMFGWDGCRWDWSFLPCSPNDPLYQPLVLTAPEKLEWFNSKGESCYKLYPNQDALAAKLHDAWVAAVTNRHPKFVPTWNMNASRGIFERNPTYMDTLTKDGIGLLEYLLNISGKYPTPAEWARPLTEDTQRVRRNGCQTTVGHMSNKVNEGTPGEQAAKMTCVFSGSKWLGGPKEYRYWGAPRRSFAFAVRFAEYFYSREFRQLSPERRAAEVKVDAKGRGVFWNEFVFERRRGSRRDVLVDILNASGDAHFVCRQRFPDPVEGLSVEIAAKPGERLVRAHALLPGDEPVAVALAVDGGRITLPRFEEGASLVCTFDKEGGAR